MTPRYVAYVLSNVFFGYVIRDTRRTDNYGFWSPLPRLVTAVQRRARRNSPCWDYWSVSEELHHRAAMRAPYMQPGYFNG